MYSEMDVMDVIEANLSLESGGVVAFLPFERLEGRMAVDEGVEGLILVTTDNRRFQITVKEIA